MISGVLHAPDLTVSLGQTVAAVLLTAGLLSLRHLLSQAQVAALLGLGEPGPGPFRWPLCGGPRQVAVHRLLVALLLGVPVAGTGMIMLGPGGFFELAVRGSGVGWALGIGAIAAAVLSSVMVVISRWPGMGARYPAMRTERWTYSVTLLDASTWAVYLAAYELLMRGLLLGVLAAALGPLPAIIATMIADALAHIPQGRQETFGSACSAVLFGALALTTGGILAPFIAHLAVAVSIDLCCARHHAKGARSDGTAHSRQSLR